MVKHVVILLLAAATTACAESPEQDTSSSTPRPRGTVDAIATPGPTPEPAAPEPSEQVTSEPSQASGGEGSASVDDPQGDLADTGGNPVDGPEYMDAVRFDASVDGSDLQVTVVLAQNAPTGIDGTIEQINYLVVIDTDGPEDWDYWLSAENRTSGEYAFVLTDWSDSYSYDSQNGEFPGAGAVSEGVVLYRVPLDALGNPTSMRVALWTQKSDALEVVAEDYVPDAAADLSGDAGWLEILP